MRLIELADADTQDVLDDYVEAHVHGVIELSKDVEALVLDPCYRGTEAEQQAGEMPCPVEWHQGFRASTDVIDQYPEYRGRDYVELAHQLAQGGVLTPRIVGDAARTGNYDEQALKRVWHYVARFGTNY